MVRALILPTVCGALLAGHVFVSTTLPAYRAGLIEQSEEIIPLPAGVLKLISLDYRNLIADLIFSRTMSFYGGKLNRRETVDAETYRTIYNRLDVASDLDPYFVDPYFFGQSVLAWGAGMPMEANALLDRGRRFRTDDWVIPFFMGFNAFYFLRDNAQGATYLMESSRRPGSPPLAGLLAARLASQSGGTETAVAFLEQLLLETEDDITGQNIRKRLGALRGIEILDQAVQRYRMQFGKLPASPQTLVEQGFLTQLPTDPYGGTFYLNADGRVWTTSDLRSVKP
jgi:hypothetical protein